MKQPIRQQANGQGRLVVEVVPVQELMKDRLIEERRQADTSQHPRPDRALRLLGHEASTGDG